VKIFELLSFWGLNERFCEADSYAHDWPAGKNPMPMIGVLL